MKSGIEILIFKKLHSILIKKKGDHKLRLILKSVIGIQNPDHEKVIPES